MYCKKCGSQIPDNAVFCTECGARTNDREERYIPVAQPVKDPVPDAAPILVLGILSIALAGIGGLVCAIICFKKVKAYIAAGGALTGIAKVGRILSIVGLALSIATCVYVTVYLCILFAVYGTVVFTMIAGLLSYNFNY
ncbi:MAG: zinc ribbon domain-containing protein [Clostridia bacterium]|nr:zinc ribbon domain-containing protein [Clostridia bacterium]